MSVTVIGNLVVASPTGAYWSITTGYTYFHEVTRLGVGWRTR
jgi:hypothetical protein